MPLLPGSLGASQLLPWPSQVKKAAGGLLLLGSIFRTGALLAVSVSGMYLDCQQARR